MAKLVALRGRRVLVTGHTGFKGAWLSAWLLKLGAEPIGYALEPPTEPNLFDTIGLTGRMDHLIADVRDREALARRIHESKPDAIVHMAAQPLVRESYATPVETFDTNVMGTVHLLDALRAFDRPCAALVVTSDKCYENAGQQPCREEDPLGGHDPYSASKGAAEIVVSAYRRSYFADGPIALASARAGNVIGGGDWAVDRIVPDIVRALRNGEAPQLRNPQAVRPWQHVLDALSGYLTLLSRMLEGERLDEGWNFGPLEPEAVTVREVTERFLELWPHEDWKPSAEQHAPHESARLQLDCTKAAEQLDWKPRWDVAAAVEQTVRWYRADHAGEDMAAFTDRQLEEYGR